MLPRPSAALLILFAVLPLALACGGDSLKPKPPADPSELYWDVVLDHHAVLLATSAPYDTLKLVATPRNSRGEALPGLPQAQYSSNDIEHVTVTPDGVLHAIAPTPPGALVLVTATLLAGNLKYTDMAVVRVVSGETLPMVASLSVHPLPPDTAKVAVTNRLISLVYYDTLPVLATDAAGEPISTSPGDPDGVVPVDIRAADTTILQPVASGTVDYSFHEKNIIQGNKVGTTKIYASTTALGVTVADTLEYRVGWPLGGLVQVYPPPGPAPIGLGMPQSNIFRNAPDITIAAGGFVMWANTVDTMLQSDIHFADADVPNVAPLAPPPAFAPFFISYFCTHPEEFPSDCTNGGNALLGRGGYRWAMRSFPVPGTYEYTSTEHPGSKGRIVVVDER